jgi:hypothetical protein
MADAHEEFSQEARRHGRDSAQGEALKLGNTEFAFHISWRTIDQTTEGQEVEAMTTRKPRSQPL